MREVERSGKALFERVGSGLAFLLAYRVLRGVCFSFVAM